MKKTGVYILMNLSLLLSSPVWTGCNDDFKYSKDYSIYDGVKLNVDMTNEDNVLNLNLINKTYRVQVNVTPQDVRINSQEFTFEIEDESIATVDETGLITMLKEGETKLDIKLKGKPEIATSCIIKVKPIIANKLNIPSEPISIKEGNTLNIAEIVSVTPSIANMGLSYIIADETIATIDENNNLQALKEGNTTITVSTTDGSNLSGVINIEVTGFIYIQEIKFSNRLFKDELKANDQINIAENVIILPENADNPTISYSIKSGNDIISLSDDGTITCLKPGTAKILAKAEDGSGTEKEVEICVYDEDTEITWADRSGWTVSTSALYKDGKNYIPDNATGKPEDILDNKSNTYLSLRKPEYFDIKGEEKGDNTELYFIVDTKKETSFNYIKYEHRSLNNTLSANKIEVYGSNDNQSFTLIGGGYDVLYDTAKSFEIYVPNSTYRYIKIKATDWKPYTGSTGATLQIAEFNVGKKEAGSK